MDLFSLIFNAVSPYLFGIAKLAFSFTLFSCFIKIIRSKSGGSMSNSAGMQNFIQVFVGYMLCRGIPVIISITDSICNEIVKNMGG